MKFFFKVCRFFYSVTFYLFSSCLICGRTPGIDNQNDSMVDIFSEISIPGLLKILFHFTKNRLMDLYGLDIING